MRIFKNAIRYLSIKNSGSIAITRFDYEKGIYSGVFNFSAVNRDDLTDTIEITEGRFDIGVAKLNE